LTAYSPTYSAISVKYSLLFVCAVVFFPVAARAQQPAPPASDGLVTLLPNLILREVRLPEPLTPGFSHSAHFSPLTTGELDNPAVSLVNSFTTLMTSQLSTFPLGSGAGGFTYRFDPAVGTFQRSTSSFGPYFAERSTTIGRGRMSGGFTYQHTRYNRFEGLPLDDGSIKFYLRHRECCTAAVPPATATVEEPNGTRLNPFFEGDVIEAALSVKVKTDTVAFFGTYGVTDRLDLGVAVPILRVDLDASVFATVQRLATVNIPNIHTFVRGDPNAVSNEVSSQGSATGLGDLVVRAKYRLLDWAGGGGLAAATDLRLPTGDAEDLLGGATQTKVYLVASRADERFGQHVNFGYTFSGSVGRGASQLGDLPNEVNYAAGAEYVAHPKLTLIGDLVGRSLPDAARLGVQSKTFQFVQATGGPVMSTQFDEFEPRSGGLNLLFGTVGAKFNPVGNLLISGGVLFPLTDGGLRNRVTTTIGIDYAF
jgi:Putative MetA-pathway of phenol degradation